MRNVHYSSSRVHPRGKKALIIILIITGIVLIALIVPQLIYRRYTGKEIGRTEDNPDLPPINVPPAKLNF